MEWLKWYGVLAPAAAIAASSALGVLGLGPVDSKTDASAGEAVAAQIRRGAWALAVGGTVVVLVISARGHADSRIAAWLQWTGAVALGCAVAAFSAGLIARALLFRHLVPTLSRWMRRWRVEQATDQRTDITMEFGRLKTRNFDPEKHFRDGLVVLGEDLKGRPVSIPTRVVRETHAAIQGPTRYGKGVLLGCVMSQLIRQGSGCWYFDPKEGGDKRLRALLADQARKAERPFYIVDLVSGLGRYAPFAGGSELQRAERIIAAFKVEDTGEQADFYRRPERRLVHTTVAKVSAAKSSVNTLLKVFTEEKISLFKGDPKRAGVETSIEAGLGEWARYPGVAGQPAGAIDVRRAIRERAVVYVRTHVRGVAREAARILLMELTSTAMEEAPAERGEHIQCVVDEARNLISGPVVDSLTTAAGAGLTIWLAYQSVLDMGNIDDKRLDGRVVLTSVNTNCQIKVFHKAGDPETAELASKLTGTRVVKLDHTETTEVGALGGERWGDQRSVKTDETPLIAENTLIALPQRVGVAIIPDQPATVVFTRWINSDDSAWDAAANRAEAQSMGA